MSPEKQVTQEQYDQFDNRMLEQVEINITEKAQEMEKTLNQKIKEEFDANGIVIPYNQMEVYVHQQK